MLLLVTVAFLGPLVASSMMSLVLIRWGPSWGLVDRPTLRKNHARPVALGGGVAICLAVILMLMGVMLAGYLINQQPSWTTSLPTLLTQHAAGIVAVGPLLAMMLIAALVQMGVGLWDDLRRLDFRLRLIVEVGLVCLLISQGVELAFLPGWHVITVPLTILWIVGLTNAFNFLDNMDGLSAGVGLIASGMLAIISWLVGDLFLLGCYVILAGALAGFLQFNWTPARIFMGDAGSNFLGFWMGTLTVISTFKTEAYSHVTLLAPLCVLAVPIYDVATVTMIRWSQGRSPFHADRQHFSHRLVELGFSRLAAVSIIHLVALVTGLSGLALYFVEPSAVWLVLGQLAALLLLLAILDIGTWRQGKDASLPENHS